VNIRRGIGPWGRRVAARVIAALAAVITALCLLLLVSAWRNDAAIGAHPAQAVADVGAISFNRAVVSFTTADGSVHIPSNGVLYPEGLRAGDRVRVVYDATNPELVKVAGRDFTLALLPVGTVVLITWLIAAPLLWWFRRSRSHAGEQPSR